MRKRRWEWTNSADPDRWTAADIFLRQEPDEEEDDEEEDEGKEEDDDDETDDGYSE